MKKLWVRTKSGWEIVCRVHRNHLLSYIKKVMQEKQLFQRYTMQGLLDELDVIECYERPGHDLQFGEITKRQIELYDALGVALPTSL